VISGLKPDDIDYVKGRESSGDGGTVNIKQVRTKRDYNDALKSVEALMNAKTGTVDGDALDILVTLIQAYEAKHFPMLLPDPVDSVKFVMEQRGLTAHALPRNAFA
jgi:HTH-type transcriptional regulator / antitoxin HigA